MRIDSIDDFVEGFVAQLRKQANDQGLFSVPNGALFPTSNSQAKWKFAKGQNYLRLSDGTQVYHFDYHEGEHEENEFKLKRGKDPQANEFDMGSTSTGLAQVHRSDPGSIYFTLQEGHRNPTYTFKHTGEDNWTAVPKKRKQKAIKSLDMAAVKEGMEKELSKCGGLDSFLGNAVGKGVNSLQQLAMFPGRDWERNSGLGMALTGAGLGGAYHLGKKHLYNTDEENEQEAQQGWSPLLKRTLLPAAGLGLASAIEGTLAPNFYKHIAAGNPDMHNIVPMRH